MEQRNRDIMDFDQLMEAMDRELEMVEDGRAEREYAGKAEKGKGKGKQEIIIDSEEQEEDDDTSIQRAMDHELRRTLLQDPDDYLLSSDSDSEPSSPSQKQKQKQKQTPSQNQTQTPDQLLSGSKKLKTDYNLIKNFLESYQSQGGGSGPVASFAGRVGEGFLSGGEGGLKRGFLK